MVEGGKGPTPGERLRRLLVVVPYIVGNPGVKVDLLAQRFAVPREQLVEDLALLFVTGAPPYGPGDLIDVDVDEDDRVTIRMAPWFEKPVAMTRPEGLDLYFRARAAAASAQPGSPLHGAVAKLQEALGEDVAGLETMPLAVPAATLDVLADAARDHRICEITYHAASTGERSVRRIEPEEVFLGIGAWYVDAWDHLRDEERLFRVDRISEVRATADPFEPRGLRGSDRPLYRPGQDDVEVRLRLSPRARWVAEYYAVQDMQISGDDVLVTVRSGRRDWLLRLLLRLGPDATVVSPPEIAAEVAELARRTLERYRNGSGG